MKYYIAVLACALLWHTGKAQNVSSSVLEIMDVATGKRTVVKEFPFPIISPTWTPDGKWLVLSVSNPGRTGGQMFRISTDGSATTELIYTGFDNSCCAHLVTPDGKAIAFTNWSRQDWKPRIYTVPINGGIPKMVTRRAPSYLHGISADGKWLGYCAERNGNYDIYIIPTLGGDEIRLTTADGSDDGAEFSPDGKYIWFCSSRTGLMQIWRMNFDGSEQTQITFDENLSSWFPHVSPDGKQVVYMAYNKDDLGMNEHLPMEKIELRLMSTQGGKAKSLTSFYGGYGSTEVSSWSPDSKRIAFVRYTSDVVIVTGYGTQKKTSITN